MEVVSSDMGNFASGFEIFGETIAAKVQITVCGSKLLVRLCV